MRTLILTRNQLIDDLIIRNIHTIYVKAQGLSCLLPFDTAKFIYHTEELEEDETVELTVTARGLMIVGSLG